MDAVCLAVVSPFGVVVYQSTCCFFLSCKQAKQECGTKYGSPPYSGGVERWLKQALPPSRTPRIASLPPDGAVG
jgi:hypothetical protein